MSKEHSFALLMHEGLKEKRAVFRAKTVAYLSVFNFVDGASLIITGNLEAGLIRTGISVALIGAEINATLGAGKERLNPKNE